MSTAEIPESHIAMELDNRYRPARVGWPRLRSEPLRTHVESDQEYLSSPSETFEELERLFAAYGLPLHRRFIGRRYYDGDRAADAPLALIMVTDLREAPEEDISEILHRVSRTLGQISPTAELELIDAKSCFEMKTIAVHPSEKAAIDVWDSVSNDIVQYLCRLQQEEGCRWATVDLLHRGSGSTREDCPLTVVIGSPDANQDLWYDRATSEIRQLTDDQFEVEVLYTKGFEARNTDGDVIDISAYADPIQMGASIGERDTEGSGTLGGLVKLRSPNGLEKSYALTNHHVAVGQPLDHRLGRGEALYPDHPILQASRPTMVTPADHDHTTHFSQRIEDLYFWLDRMHKTGGLRERSEQAPTNQKLKSYLRTAEDKAEELSAELNHIETHNRNVGSLWAASGRRVRESLVHGESKAYNWLCDWALIEINPNKSMSNAVVDPSPPLEQRRKGVKSILQSGMLADEYGTLNPATENNVAFKGRTSGWSFGTVNTVHSRLNRFDTCHIAQTYGLSKKKPGYGWAIVPRIGLYTSEVSLGGDSGSVVLMDEKDNVARWVGLLFGSNAAGLAYMAPIDVVMEDIEAVTGWTVVEPT
ncbi:hypothetical protein BU26DRAFT_510057 [Trematosphaeria pertusa]|uniref:Uncharacterized protein n=1 Tax=Trematosphaeria pertusa TaxID=390896 RepID=A0A6A6I078_9PLEO|nr:uncharacterized protein BU26DRAFT_510057 [Trematosphaeria pertusa]KAF2243559.1 hypothetical protein BU26DRAFT_510057 [Trematosphaeria pertusa]